MNGTAQTDKPKKRRTGLTVFLCILLLVLAVLGGTAYRYRAGIAVLLDNFGKSSAQVSSEREDYEQKTQALLDKLSSGMTLSALPAADLERLRNGEITPAEAVAILMRLAETAAAESATASDETASPDETVPPATDGTTSAPAEPATSAATAETTAPATAAPPATTAQTATTAAVRSVEELISAIYKLRAEFLDKIDLMIATGTAEVEATPKEKRTLTFKIDFINRYLDRGEALERECDARMEQLLDELKTALTESGGDLSLIDEIRALYVQEKKLYKAELYQKYT